MKRKSIDDQTATRTVVYELHLNRYQKRVFMSYCDYRRYIWNEIKDYNDHMYQAYKYEKTYYAKVGMRVNSEQFCNSYPSLYTVKAVINKDKKHWEYQYPSKIALMAMTDFDNAMKNFLDPELPDWGFPKFRSKKAPRQGFKLPFSSVTFSGKTVQLAKGQKSKKGNLVLKTRQEFLDYPAGTLSFFTEKGKFYVAVPYYIPKRELPTGCNLSGRVGIDLNTGHYDFYDGKHYIMRLQMAKLDYHYKKIKHYQRLLARKRNVSKQNKKSHNYAVVRTKLQHEYTKTVQVQNDFLEKLTTKLCLKYKEIVIEDLDVKHMKMSHIASKGMHRAMFGKFRRVLTYKADQYSVDLIIADRFYPSTQICSKCGYRKTGDERITLKGNKKHHTGHDDYICYNCGAKMQRDPNAAVNLFDYPESEWLKEEKIKKAQQKKKVKKAKKN